MAQQAERSARPQRAEGIPSGPDGHALPLSQRALSPSTPSSKAARKTLYQGRRDAPGDPKAESAAPPTRLQRTPAAFPVPSSPRGGAAHTGHAGSRGARRFVTLSRSEFHLERREAAFRPRTLSSRAPKNDAPPRAPRTASPAKSPAPPPRNTFYGERLGHASALAPRGGRGQHEGSGPRGRARRHAEPRHVGRSRGSQCAWPRRLAWG